MAKKKKQSLKRDSIQQIQATGTLLPVPASSSFGIKCDAHLPLSKAPSPSKRLSAFQIREQLKEIKRVGDLAATTFRISKGSLPIQDLAKPLANLMNLCQHFATSALYRERILNEYTTIFPGRTMRQVIMQYAQNMLTFFALACTQQNGHDLLIETFVDYRQQFALICEESLFVILAAAIDAELANSYAAKGDYSRMLETFERMEPSKIKDFLRAGRIGDLCLFLISELDNWLVNSTDSIPAADYTAIATALGPPQPKELRPAVLDLVKQLSAMSTDQDSSISFDIMGQLSTIATDLEPGQEEKPLAVKQQYKPHEIIALVEKYGELALAALSPDDQEERYYLPFIIAYSIFRAIASDEHVSTDIIQEKFYQALKKFPSEETMMLIDIENTEQLKGKLYFQKAMLIHLYHNFLLYRLPQQKKLIHSLDKNFRETLILAAELQFFPAEILACEFVEGDPRMRVYQQKVAEAGSVSALYNEAHDLIAEGVLQNPTDVKKIFDYLEKASKKRYAKATFMLAQIYSGKFQPSVVEINHGKALEYYEMAAEQGQISALLEIGRIRLFFSKKPDFSYALGLWQQVKQESPDTVEVYTLLATSYLHRILSLHNLRSQNKITPDIMARWPRIIISYVLQGLLQCKTGLEKLATAAKKINLTPTEQADLAIKQMEFFTLICFLIRDVNSSVQQGHFIFVEKLLNELFRQLDFGSLSQCLPLALEFQEIIIKENDSVTADIEHTPITAIRKFFENLQDDSAYSSLDALITRKYEERSLSYEVQKEEIKNPWLTFDDFLMIDEKLFSVAEDFPRGHASISLIFAVYNNFSDQELSNIILTLYEASCLIWQTGSSHRDVFASYREQFNNLLKNLMRELEKLNDSEEVLIENMLSYLPKTLIALGRLRLSRGEKILHNILDVLIKLAMKYSQRFSLEDDISLLYAFTLLPIADINQEGNKFLFVVLQKLQSNELNEEDLTFSQLSQLYYSLVVIDAIQRNAQRRDCQLISMCGQIAEKFHAVLTPFFSQIYPYPHLHQLILAMDYYRFVNPDFFRKISESPGFSGKYNYVFSRVQKGHISKLQKDIVGPLRSIFPNAALSMELFYGLLPGDVSVIPASGENTVNTYLLFEPGGPTHYLCNDITEQENKDVCADFVEERARIPRDIFHDQYKIYWFAKHGAQETVGELLLIVNMVLKMANKPAGNSYTSSSSSSSHRMSQLQVFPISFTILDRDERTVQKHIRILLQPTPFPLSGSSVSFFHDSSNLPTTVSSDLESASRASYNVPYLPSRGIS